MGRLVGGPYSSNKNLTALSTENLTDTFSYTPGVGGPYSQSSKALPDRWKAKQLGTASPKGAASKCAYGGTVMGNALFVRAHCSLRPALGLSPGPRARTRIRVSWSSCSWPGTACAECRGSVGCLLQDGEFKRMYAGDYTNTVQTERLRETLRKEQVRAIHPEQPADLN
jgi:hypothetical protein